jgi:hypothetical protein
MMLLTPYSTLTAFLFPFLNPGVTTMTLYVPGERQAVDCPFPSVCTLVLCLLFLLSKWIFAIGIIHPSGGAASLPWVKL